MKTTKFQPTIATNNELLTYLGRLVGIVYAMLENDEEYARKEMQSLEPQVTALLRRFVATSGTVEQVTELLEDAKVKSNPKSSLIL